MLLLNSQHFANVKGGYLSLTFYIKTRGTGKKKLWELFFALKFLKIKIIFI